MGFDLQKSSQSISRKKMSGGGRDAGTNWEKADDPVKDGGGGGGAHQTAT